MQAESIPKVPEYDRVVVPLDGSLFTESALLVADELCRLFDAGLELAGFGVEAGDEAELQERLLELAGRRLETGVTTGVDWDPADGSSGGGRLGGPSRRRSARGDRR